MFWRPKPSRDITVRAHKAQKRSVRRFPESAINAFGRWVSSHHWFTSLDSVASVDSLTESFNTDVKTEIDIHFPLKSVKIHPTYRPWMTSRIKQFILERRRAFYSDRNGRWRELRTRVRDEIAARKKAFYSEKLSYLKNTDPRKWWSLVKKLSGKSRARVQSVMRPTIKYCLAWSWQMGLTTFCFSNIWCSSPELPNAPCLFTRTGRVTCHPPHESLQKTAQAKSFQSLWSWRDSKSNSEVIRVRAFWARDHYL